jgi:hypothetical protein
MEEWGDLHGVRVCKGALVFTNLLFVDDCFLLCRPQKEKSIVLKNILSTYEDVSGQQINFQKFKVLVV